MANFLAKHIKGDVAVSPSLNRSTSASYYALHVIHSGIIIPFEMKKCCKKYKKGKRCKKCPNN